MKIMQGWDNIKKEKDKEKERGVFPIGTKGLLLTFSVNKAAAIYNYTEHLVHVYYF